jgi:hypothetical protein
MGIKKIATLTHCIFIQILLLQRHKKIMGDRNFPEFLSDNSVRK